MHVQLNKLILLVLALSSCLAHDPVHRLIDQKEEYVWINTEGEHRYMLRIDSSEGIWFHGIMVVDQNDTLYLKGFEKGNVHPTSVNLSKPGSHSTAPLDHIEILTLGNAADTLVLNNTPDSIRALPLRLYLFKSRKTS